MDEDGLDLAMQYESKNPSNERDKKDLGRFGLGLKTASLSQCKCLSVITIAACKMLKLGIKSGYFCVKQLTFSPFCGII